MRPNLLPIRRILLGLAAGFLVIAFVVGGLILVQHYAHRARLQTAKLDQASQVVNGVAAIQELAEPWSSKTFVFHSPGTKESISSIVIRLPEGQPDQPGSYWAFSMQPLFGRCQLEYITDLQKLSSDYQFDARHPMVGDPCSRAVFDPLQMADVPKGAWARGAIVKGSAFRPPLAIEIQIQSDQLVAARME